MKKIAYILMIVAMVWLSGCSDTNWQCVLSGTPHIYESKPADTTIAMNQTIQYNVQHILSMCPITDNGSSSACNSNVTYSSSTEKFGNAQFSLVDLKVHADTLFVTAQLRGRAKVSVTLDAGGTCKNTESVSWNIYIE